MKEQINAVKKFHEVFQVENGQTPQLITESDFLLRHRLMQEENEEYKEACWNGDLAGIADALGDQLYILCGTILKHGLQDKIEEVFKEIQRSNMSKLGKCPHLDKGDGECWALDCETEHRKPIFREDGKILKGPYYTPPDIGKIVNQP